MPDPCLAIITEERESKVVDHVPLIDMKEACSYACMTIACAAGMDEVQRPDIDTSKEAT